MTIQFGITITGKPMTDVDPAGQAAEMLDLARTARDVGLDAIVVGQHFLTAPYRYLQPVPTLARLIPETATMDLVTGILLLPLLQPVEVAEQIATLDVLAGGRVTMGVGLGYRDAEFSGFGIRREDRVARQTEALEVIRRLWAGETVTHHGRFYDVDGVGASILPVQEPGPPIWVAANAERPIMRATAAGHLPYIGPRPDRDSIAQWLARAREANPELRVPIRRDLLLFENDMELGRAIDNLRDRYEVYRSWGREADGSGRKAGTSVEDLRGSVLMGSEEQVVEEIRRYEEIGVSTIVFRVIWPGMEHRQSLEMVESIGRILPAVRAASRAASPITD